MPESQRRLKERLWLEPLGGKRAKDGMAKQDGGDIKYSD